MSSSAIGIVVVSYNTASLLRRCLTSIVASTKAPVLVIDNQSRDGSPDVVRREFPEIRLRAETSNRGYGAAANLAVHDLGTKYVLLLNADTEVTPGTVESLAAYLDSHPKVALVGPRIVTGAGIYETSAHRFPTPLSLLLGAPWWPGPEARRATASPRRRGIRSLLDGYVQRNEWRSRPVDWVLGAALVIRRQAFNEVGGFDEAYFLYQEEIDLCFRLRSTGWDVHYAPVATVLHVGGASTSQHSAKAFGQFVRSTQRFARLRFTRRKAAAVRAVLAGVLIARLARARLELAWLQDTQRRERVCERLAAWQQGLAALRASDTDLGSAR